MNEEHRGQESDEETGPQGGRTEQNPQSGYYRRYDEARGEQQTGPQRASGARRWVVAVIAVAVVAVGAGAIYWGTRGDDATPTVQSPAPTTASTSSGPSGSSTPSTAPTDYLSRPLQTGWQSVSANNSAASTTATAAYDVPKANWALGKSNNSVDVAVDAASNPVIGVRQIAEYRNGQCATSSKQSFAWMGFFTLSDQTPSTKASAERVARSFAGGWSPAMSATATKGLSTPVTKQVTINQGTAPAWQSSITMTSDKAWVPKLYGGNNEPPEGGKACTSKKYDVHAVVFTAGGKKLSVVIVRELGLRQSLSDADLRAVTDTIRAVS